MDTRDLALALRDALECSTIATHTEDSDGELIKTGAVYIDFVDVSNPARPVIVDEMGNRFFLHVTVRP